MKKRTITGIIMVLIIVPLMLVQQLFIGFQILAGLAAIVGTLEMMKMYNKHYSVVTKVFVSLLTLITFLALTIPLNNSNLNILVEFPLYFIIVLLTNVFVLLMLSAFNDDFTGDNFGKLLSTTLYVGLGASALVMLRGLSVKFIILLLLTTTLTDVFAYIIGMSFGKNKMAPTISPNKSWEGAIGGTIVATLVVSLIGIFYGVIFKQGFLNPQGSQTIIDGFANLSDLSIGVRSLIIVLLAISISIVGQTGDLVASKMKRNYNIKDFGNIFPGHGGVMDRFDSSFFGSMYLLIVLMIISIL